MPLTFVVGTGRCGSTMLSNLLQQHPDVLSLNELINAINTPYNTIAGGVSRERWTIDIDGPEFWQTLNERDPSTEGIMDAGLPLPEFIYPSTGRFSTATGIPKVCNQVLPMLSDDPDSLYDKLSAEIPAWPLRPTADHCRALFAMLADLTGRHVAVERSGGSMTQVPTLAEQFPDARFVLLHRNGPDCALSMSRHVIFRLAILRIIAARAAGISDTAPPGELSAAPDEFNGLLTPPFDKQRFMSYSIPVATFAYLWSYTVREGVSALQELPRDRWMSVKYEDLISAPREPLTRLAGFLGAAAPRQWLDRACDFVNPGRAGSASAQLDPAELAAVRNSCAPGTRILAALDAEQSR